MNLIEIDCLKFKSHYLGFNWRADFTLQCDRIDLVTAYFFFSTVVGFGSIIINAVFVTVKKWFTVF